MYIKFYATGKLVKYFPKKKIYTLHEADEKLKTVAGNVPILKNKKPVTIEIFESEQESLLLAEFEIGTEEASNLLLLVDTLFKTSFPGSSEQDKQKGLRQIEQAFKAEENSQIEATDEFQPVESQAVNKNSIEAPKENQPLKKKQIKEKRALPSLKGGLQHKWLLGILSGLFLGCLLGFFLFNSFAATQATPEKESYDTLLKQKKYYQLVTDYPNKEEEVIVTLYTNQDRKNLAKLSNLPLAQFYLSFLEEKWDDVVKNSQVPQTKKNLAMKGYAYLQQGNLEEAIILNEEIDSETLAEQIKEEQIKRAYQAIHQREIGNAEKLNKEVNDKQLTEDIGIAKSIVNLLDKYKKDEDNSQLSRSERKEATENYKLWEKNLQQLGEKSNE